jgi:hypothetical protein
MTGPNHLMHHPYVVAYQVEIKHDIRSARLGDSRLRATYQRAAAWLIETRARSTATKRSRVAFTNASTFDRSCATGACEISDGLVA